MRRVPIRMKLAGALAVPLSALVVVTVLEVRNAAEEASKIQDQTALAEISLGPTSILSAIEWERNAVSVAMLGMEDAFNLPVEDPAEAAAQTNEAIASFRAEVDRQDQDIIDAYAPAFTVLDGLDELRAVEAGTPEADRVISKIDDVSGLFDDYTDIRDQLVEANRRVAVAIDDPLLRQGADLVDLNSTQTDLVAILVRDLLVAQVGGAGDGVNTPQEIALISRNVGHLRSNWATMTAAATGPYVPLLEQLLASEEVQRFPEVVDEAVDTGVVDIPAVTTYAASEDPDKLAYTVFGRQVEDVVLERASDLRAAAEARQRWFLVLALAAVLVATLAAWLVSRSITRPLRSLTREAKEMAERRLPDAVLDILETPLGDDVRMPSIAPVSSTTRDEVADVAVALNTVQDTALDLAVEQAVLRRNIADSFVNLGRRNQNLLGRQLDFITELETNETDADNLANLFRLDHLATRMRRNAESLLVLAGIEPPRQWAAPVRLTDVIRAALGEVEDYQRVTVRGVEPATVLGSAAADLAHLLAELIENALVFSPPDQTVDIRGRNRPDGYTLAIIDSGLGMPSDDIVAANRRLAGAESFTIAPSKYLGHYVAGNLAARHDIHVHLDNSPGNGVTATIDLPPTLLTTDTALAAPVTPPHGTRAIAAPEPLPALPTDSSWTEDTPDWLMPDTAAVGQGASVYPPPPPTEARRTESGLTKRNARPSPAAPIGAEGPSGDLLDALSRHNARLHGGAPSSYAPSAPAPTPERSPLPTRGWEAPSAPPPVGPAARTASRSWPLPTEPGRAPRSRPGPLPTPDRLPTPDPIPAPDPATLPGPPEPFTPTWTPSPAPDGWEPPHSSRARATAPEPGPAPAPPLPSRGQSDMAAGGDTTTGGLARRVRGAQLPTTEPVRMRRPDRAQAPASSGAATPAPRTAPARTPEQRRQADDVYNFLSNFTAGVRRGLDEASHEPQAGPDEPHPGDPRWR